MSGSDLNDPELPLHLALAHLLVKSFPLVEQPQGSPTYHSAGFISSILTLVSKEVFEVDDTPATYDELRNRVDLMVKKKYGRRDRLRERKRARGIMVEDDADEDSEGYEWMRHFGKSFESIPEGSAFLDNLERDIRERINEDDEEDLSEIPEPFERRSPLGLFLRRIALVLRKLSFMETSSLSRSVGRWCGTSDPGPSFHGISNRKYAMEDTLDARSKAMDSMRSSMNSGDYSGALNSLRRFYDYQFPFSHRGRHQHALLNLASFHYSTGGLPSAQEAINEAIQVARAEGDRSCLDHCMSLSHRIEAELQSAPGPSKLRVEQQPIEDSRLPQVTSPMDELWVLQVALDLGEPVHIAQRRTRSALHRYDSVTAKTEDKQMQGWLTEFSFDEGAWHISQAGLWGMLGSSTLAELHEDMALEAGGRESRLEVLIARAERSALRGRFDEALGILVDLECIDGLDYASFKRWARCVWSILRHQVELNQNDNALDLLDILQPSPASFRRTGHGAPLRERPDGGDHQETAHEQIKTSLRKATKMTESNAPPHLVLPLVLSAIHFSSELGLWTLYRLGTVIFGEVLLSMEGQKMGKKAIEEVEKIWPELVESGDEETIARAALVLGKAFVEVSLDEDDLELLDHAVEHLHRARTSGKKIQARRTISVALELLALIAQSRNETSAQEAMQKELERVEADKNSSALVDQVRSIGEVVKLVSVRVSEGWR